MQSDLTFIFTWWLTLFLIGIVSLPITNLFFRRFVDSGYGFSKTIGTLLLTYIIFFFSTFKIIPFTLEWLYIILVLILSINLLLFFRNKGLFFKVFKENANFIIFQEILFTLGFLFWAFVRGHQPDIEGLEKLMDFGFVNSILRSKFLPPTDMWFAGKSINYYWFGHLWTAVLTKITRIPSPVTYNLMLATIMGLSLTSVFSLISTLTKNLKIESKRMICLAGFISALLLVFGGNFHTPFYVLKEGGQRYWYPDATRFIGYNPDTNDKTIHEFPIYSFIVSDLHAHLLNLPFVLLYLGLLFGFVSDLKNKDEKFKNMALKVLPLGFLLGVFFATNTWDFGNYLLVFITTLFICEVFKKPLSLNKIYNIFLQTIFVVFTAGITVFPFLKNFDSIAQGIAFVNSQTPIWQLSILWGFPAILTLVFALTILKTKRNINSSDFFVISLLTTSWILIFLPEIIYVKDIYIASHHRANTMFKLTYQAFVMFYLSSGYIIIRSLNKIESSFQRLLVSFFYCSIIFLLLIYPYFGIKSYYGDLKTYKGLRGDTWLKEFDPSLYRIVYWFNQNVKGQPVILEAPGDSYTKYNVISSYTGLPTVSGWFVHEWLWRGDSRFPQERVMEISQFYTTSDINKALAFIKKYRVEYVIVGNFEREKFPALSEKKFSQIGKLVFSTPTTNVYRIN